VKAKGRAILINLLLALLSTGLALVVGEAALRLLGLGPMYVSPERDRFWKYDSLLGWALQPGQEGSFETAQFRITVHINRRGLRDREHAYERSGEARRILVLGDSFAWGYGVEEPERFTQRLETLLGAEVINAAVSGYSTDQELLWYRDEGRKYDQDLVIVGFTGNDIGHNEQQLVYAIYYKPQFVQRGDGLILTGYPVPQTSPQGRLIYTLSQRSALGYFLVQRYFELRSAAGRLQLPAGPADAPQGGPSSAADPFGLTIALLNEMKTIAESKGATFLVVATDRWWNGPAQADYAGLMDALETQGFLVLDVERLPGFDPETMLIPNDGHWNRAGHEFVAEAITEVVERQQLLGQQP
jgi:lysophospholipase L1-like esterase